MVFGKQKGIDLKHKEKKKQNLTLEEMTLWQKLVKLFVSTITISSVAFGGGFVVLPLLKKTYSEKYKWIKSEEFSDVIAIAQSSPGTIAGNASMVIGYKIAGILGSVVTMIASIIPPLIILTLVYYVYAALITNAIVVYFMAGTQAGIAAVILDFSIKMMSETILNKNMIFSLILLVSAFVVAFFLEFSVIYIILIAVALGIGFSYLKLFRDKNKEKEKNKVRNMLDDNKKEGEL